MRPIVFLWAHIWLAVFAWLAVIDFLVFGELLILFFFIPFQFGESEAVMFLAVLACFLTVISQIYPADRRVALVANK